MNIYGFFVCISIIVSTLYIYIRFFFIEQQNSLKINLNILYNSLIFTNIVFISFIVGAKIWFIYTHKNLNNEIYFFNGYSTLGGIPFVFLSAFIYSKIKKINLIKILNILSFVFILSYGIVRLGCHFSKDGCWGKENCNFISIKKGNNVEEIKTNNINFFLQKTPNFLLANAYFNNQQNRGNEFIKINETNFYYFLTPLYPTSLIEGLVCVFYFFIVHLFFNIKKNFKIKFVIINSIFFILQWSLVNYYLK